MQGTVGTMGEPAGVALQRPGVGEFSGRALWQTLRYMFRHHFGVLFGTTVLPLLPVLLVQTWLERHAHPAAPWLLLAYYLLSFVCAAMLTLAISDVCLGNRPTVAGVYRRTLRPGRLAAIVGTSLLLLVLMVPAFIAFVLPGMWLLMRAWLTSAVVMLEPTRYMAAIRRSFALTQGQAWRIAWQCTWPAVLAFLAAIVLSLLVAVPLAMLAGNERQAFWIGATVAGVLVLSLYMPVFCTTMVMSYYDQRVRREAYDLRALSEDLMR